MPVSSSSWFAPLPDPFCVYVWKTDHDSINNSQCLRNIIYQFDIYLYLYKTVHVTFLGFRLIKCADSHFELRKVKVWGNETKIGYANTCNKTDDWVNTERGAILEKHHGVMMFDYPTYIIIILSILHCHLNGTHLSVNFDHGLAMARINLVPAVRAQADPGNIIRELITNIMLTRCTTFPSWI